MEVACESCHIITYFPGKAAKARKAVIIITPHIVKMQQQCK